MKEEKLKLGEDELIRDATKECQKSAEDILSEMKNYKKPEIKNEGEIQSDGIPLGDLGEFQRVPTKEVDDVFDKLGGVVFKIKNCLFRISYINRGQRRFTASLLNEKK